MRLNCELMSRDKIIATIVTGEFTSRDDALLPLFLKRGGDFETWLSGRAIDSHRTNSRLLKKALRLGELDDALLVLKVNAATITDTYWVRGHGSEMTYEQARFKTNMFDMLALRGDPDSFNQPYSPTPELTNTGSFEKCWRLIGGKWWMYKQGSDLERFSEMFACELCKALHFPTAHYELENGYIKSLDFTDGASVNFEPASGVVGDNEDYTDNFEAFHSMSPDIAAQYVALIYTDTLVFNMDRHTNNYGILRDAETGSIVSLAPNYDNNIALIARGYPRDITRENDKLIELFVEFLKNEPRALAAFEALERPGIAKPLIAFCAAKIDIPVDKALVNTFVVNGDKQICDGIQAFKQDMSMQM